MGAEQPQVDDMGRLKKTLKERGFEVVLELGPTTSVPMPTVADVEQQITELTSSSWKWPDDHFDALIVVLASHGNLDRFYAWPLPDQDRKSGPLDMADKIFSRFQLPVRDESATRASEALRGKPKIFIVDACRGIDTGFRRDPQEIRRLGRHPLAWTPTAREPSGSVDGLVEGKGRHEPIVSQDGEVVSRYTDFLFCWSTMPYNIAGMNADHSNFLDCVVRELEARPTGSLVDILTAAVKGVPRWGANPGIVGTHNMPQSAELGPMTLRKTLRLVIPHSAVFAPSEAQHIELFGRAAEAKQLESALRHPAGGAAVSGWGGLYHLVLGSAGLGKTELVKSVGRALVSSGAGERFSAILFVELRAQDTPSSCARPSRPRGRAPASQRAPDARRSPRFSTTPTTRISTRAIRRATGLRAECCRNSSACACSHHAHDA